MFFIIVLVMFLGAVGWAYSAANTNAELTKEVAAVKADNAGLKGKVTLLEHYAQDLGAAIDLPGKYEGRSDVAKDVYAGATLDGLAGVIDPSALKKRMDAGLQAVGLTSAKGIENVFSAIVVLVNDKIEREKTISSERDKALADKAEVDKKFSEATTEHTKAAGEWSQAISQAKADYTSSLTTKDAAIVQRDNTIRDVNDQLNAAKEAAAAKEKALAKDLATVRMHNSALTSKDRLRAAPDVADGKVIVARAGVATAFIDLGRKDMLQAGTIFRIKNKNATSIKGYAEVTRVEQDKAEVRLYDVVDVIGDAVREGDQLYNDLYSPNGANKRTVFLMGRFSYPYNKPQLEMLLKNLGNTLVNKMGPGVDTVILGDDAVNEAGDGFTSVTDSAEYKLANELGVEFAPLRKIRDLLKL